MVDPAESGLPSNRAFVVQLAPEGDDLDVFRGRIEHLASGQTTRFESIARLREFVERVLAGVPDEPGER
jgi:hypothetical protein